MVERPVRIDDESQPGWDNPTRVGSVRVKVQHLKYLDRPVYEINHDEKTVRFFDSAPMPLASAERINTGLRSHLDLHKPKPAPAAEKGPELAPDFLQRNINRLLEMPADLAVKRAPRWLRWLGIHSVIARE